MPNWVNNIIIIRTNNKEAIIKFLKRHIKDERFDFNTVIPEPETEADCPDEYNLNKTKFDVGLEHEPDREWFNWYNWRIDNWGTKWNSFDKLYIDYGKIIEAENFIEIKINFQTAWSAPFPVFKKLLEMYSNLSDAMGLEMVYYSTENGECGEVFMLRGEVCHSRWEFESSIEEILK